MRLVSHPYYYQYSSLVSPLSIPRPGGLPQSKWLVLYGPYGLSAVLNRTSLSLSIMSNSTRELRSLLGGEYPCPYSP